MGHSLSRVWLHVVIITKYREPFINDDIELSVFTLIERAIRSQGCYLDCINGMPDHVHILLLLRPNVCLSNLMKQIKGTTSYQINESKLIEDRFCWQNGYGAFSVSESKLPVVRNYINRQKEHHQKTGLEEEYNRLLVLHQLKP